MDEEEEEEDYEFVFNDSSKLYLNGREMEGEHVCESACASGL